MGRPIRDLTKEPKFGRLKATEVIGPKNGKNFYFKFRCDCGNEIEAKGSHVVSGNIQSCGCLRSETSSATRKRLGPANRTHGASGTPTFMTWKAMINRCNSADHPSFYRYGGRGIKVAERWMSFWNFLADMGERPNGTTIDRVNFDGDYEPGNCRWATDSEQQLNKSSNVNLTLDGVTMTIKEWSDKIGVSPKTIWSRINILNWTAEKTLTTPPKHQRGN